jgi:hypothetical protein
MKKALISYQGWVSQIVEPGEDYEIYNGPDATIQWVDAPDEITLDWTLEWSPNQERMVWVERDGPFTDNSVARSVAYGQIGQQLDMIYHELMETGTLSSNGPWAQHVTNVKSLIPKPVAQEPERLEDIMARAATEEPSSEKPNHPSSSELPAWKRFDGWWGNKE